MDAAQLAKIAKIQREIAVLKQELLDAGAIAEAEQLASYLADTAEDLQEEIDCYE